MNATFETELNDAITDALSIRGILPHYVLNKIIPIIEKHTAELAAKDEALRLAREYWDRGMPNFNTSTIEFPFKLANEINEFFAAFATP